jgi:hypothetical protein
MVAVQPAVDLLGLERLQEALGLGIVDVMSGFPSEADIPFPSSGVG